MTDSIIAPDQIGPPDLPPHIVSLARRMAHDCAQPGRYLIELTISPYPSEPAQATVNRVDTLKKLDIPT